jgi:hypothetical protein
LKNTRPRLGKQGKGFLMKKEKEKDLVGSDD